MLLYLYTLRLFLLSPLKDQKSKTLYKFIFMNHKQVLDIPGELMKHYFIIILFYKFQALRRMGADYLILLLCITVFLSYLPEAGEYSCFFVYLRLVSNLCLYTGASYFCGTNCFKYMSKYRMTKLENVHKFFKKNM